MDLIIETDLGHDPDDFFAINYLIYAGVRVRAILVSPGDPDQIAIARLICEIHGLTGNNRIPTGTSKKDRTKLSSGSIHHELLKKYGFPLEAKADGLGEDILVNVVAAFPNCELFVIGPVTSIGNYMEKHPETNFKRATMQGGFLPYSLHEPVSPHEDFIGSESKPTFNLNGDRTAGLRFLTGNISERRMVGKNICHTVLFTKDVFSQFKNNNKIFYEAAQMYLNRHDFKKFHDPTAAVCHLHPEIATWFRGNTVKKADGWTTEPNPEGDFILADINYNKLWEHLGNNT